MMIPYTAPYSTWNIIKITNSKQGDHCDQLMSDPKKYFVREVYFCQKKYILTLIEIQIVQKAYFLLKTSHSVPECGSEPLKCPKAPAHIWDLARWWKGL